MGELGTHHRMSADGAGQQCFVHQDPETRGWVTVEDLLSVHPRGQPAIHVATAARDQQSPRVLLRLEKTGYDECLVGPNRASPLFVPEPVAVVAAAGVRDQALEVPPVPQSLSNFRACSTSSIRMPDS
jgi:hypothetical protein